MSDTRIIQFKAQGASCDMAEWPTREAILEAAELTMPDVFREADSGDDRSAFEGRIVRAFREGQAEATDHAAGVRKAFQAFGKPSGSFLARSAPRYLREQSRSATNFLSSVR